MLYVNPFITGPSVCLGHCESIRVHSQKRGKASEETRALRRSQRRVWYCGMLSQIYVYCWGCEVEYGCSDLI
jgi:hypothetical protein